MYHIKDGKNVLTGQICLRNCSWHPSIASRGHGLNEHLLNLSWLLKFEMEQ
jgi:hypothetical protein